MCFLRSLLTPNQRIGIGGDRGEYIDHVFITEK